MVISDELGRVARQRHPDPHAILGPHVEDGRALARAFRPAARSVRFIDGDGTAFVARRVHEAGIFEAETPALLGPSYLVEASFADGSVEVAHDAYAFQKPTLGELDIHLFAEGKHYEIHEHLGAHIRTHQGVAGTSFAVWAPNAVSVRVTGDFNGWKGERTAMRKLGAGVWEIFLPRIGEGALYKFEIKTPRATLDKSDPFGRAMEVRPGTASRVTESRYVWRDDEWMQKRASARAFNKPFSAYEVHLQSWRKKPLDSHPALDAADPSKGWLGYRELAKDLVDYVADLGFTHVEILPVMEHPFDGSWGYQVSGYFAPTSRLGSPDDLRYLVDCFHARNIAVIFDWVPAHFPKDAAALGRFDGTALFEHPDPRRGEHQHWGTFIFDFGKNEVRNFLVASALYWLGEFHADGLRVDAVASMLYLDYSAGPNGDWLPNQYGGNENLEAVALLRELTDRVHERFPGAIISAEESTTWPGVTKPTYAGGLGFDMKWNMGWMHDTLEYFALDPIFRAFHHRLLTFGLMYQYTERFVLPLSHDEVVHLKKSLYGKMSGDPFMMRASLRAMFGYMWAHPGKKLVFMGGELGQKTEWRDDDELPWDLLSDPGHAGIRSFVRDLNALYIDTPALFEVDDDASGFRWIDANDAHQSVASFVRYPVSALERRRTGKHVVFVGNFTPLMRTGYRVGVPRASAYHEALNSDAAVYGGSNIGNLGKVRFEKVASHGFEQSIVLTLPPLSTLFLIPEDADEPSISEIQKEREQILEERMAKEALLASAKPGEDEDAPDDDATSGRSDPPPRGS